VQKLVNTSVNELFTFSAFINIYIKFLFILFGHKFDDFYIIFAIKWLFALVNDLIQSFKSKVL